MERYKFNKWLTCNMFIAILFLSGTGRTFAGNGNDWAIRMAQSEMKRHPEGWMVDLGKAPQWNYTQGLVSLAFLKVWELNHNLEYFNYAKGYADKLIDSLGNIVGYK
ncbi:MAG TPA: glycoside hydrolase family 88 protein, partial [Bacteroidales bacterium]